MVLDGEDLVLGLEDSFSIHIAEDEAAAVRTVRDLYQLVLGKLEPTAECLAEKAFYRTRKALAETAKVPPRSIRPNTPLESLLPREYRIPLWDRVAERTGLSFPGLTHSKRWKDLMLLLSMVIAVPPVIALWWALYALDWIRGIWVHLFFFPALLAWIVIVSRVNLRLLRNTAQRAIEFPPGIITAGDLSLSVLSLNAEVFEPGVIDSKRPTRETVWNRIVDMFSAQPEVDRKDIGPNTALPDAWTLMATGKSPARERGLA